MKELSQRAQLTVETPAQALEAIPERRREVVLFYTVSWCGVCKRARRYFEDNNIAYTEYDIETSSRGREDYKHLKARGVPVILVGRKRMNGFSVDGFNDLYR